MRFYFWLLAPALVAAAPAVAGEPVEVTRFHTPETLTSLGTGGVDVAAVPGLDASSLEVRALLDGVARELGRAGLVASATAGEATRVAEVRLTRDKVEGGTGPRRGAPAVNVGVGIGSGWGDGWRRHGGTRVGVGVGVGFPVAGGGGGRDLVDSELSVTIRDKASGAPLWEGRSNVRTGRRESERAGVAAQLAAALFSGFPGRSGETIEVR